MKKALLPLLPLLQYAALCGALAAAATASAQNDEFSFGVISHSVRTASEDSALRNAIEATDADNLAFVVANGIKAPNEPCTDALYERRKELLNEAKNGLIVSLAASDWAECKSGNGKSAAIGKLSRLRDLFFEDEFSIGATRIPLVRQSSIARFRTFVENARWEIGDTVFATINVPRNNNHYVFDAGRNSEFEDRLVANRDWLRRTFSHAARRRMNGIVLFSDGNPLVEQRSGQVRRDGYVETRRQIVTLAAKFPGKVLLVHGHAAKPSASPVIRWRGNLGELDAGSGWLKLTVHPSEPDRFTIASTPSQGPNR